MTMTTKTAKAKHLNAFIAFLYSLPVNEHQSIRGGVYKLDLPLISNLLKQNLPTEDDPTRNRALHVSHISQLIGTHAAAKWVWSACTYAVSISGRLLDGQHRLIAMALYYGDERLRQWVTDTYFAGKLPKSLANACKGGQPIPETEFIILISGVSPDNFAIYDTDLLKRTGADLLGMDPAAASFIDETGISANELGQTLRCIHLRCTPGKDYTGKGGDSGSYGYVAKGGRISPEAYVTDFFPTYRHVLALVQNIFVDAMAPSRDELTEYDFKLVPGSQLYLYGAACLYLLSIDNIDEHDNDSLIEEYPEIVANITRTVQNATKWVRKSLTADWKPATVGFFELWRESPKQAQKNSIKISGIIHTMKNPGATSTSSKYWETVLGTNPEQQPLLRFDGPDSRKG